MLLVPRLGRSPLGSASSFLPICDRFLGLSQFLSRKFNKFGHSAKKCPKVARMLHIRARTNELSREKPQIGFAATTQNLFSEKERVMKLFHALLSLPLTLTAFAAAHADDSSDRQGHLMVVATKAVFVPIGFDDNDDIMVVLDGTLPDTCYRLAYNTVDYDATTKSYVVRQIARHFNSVCIPAEVPFSVEAHLGVLPAGDFGIEAFGAPKESLPVTESTSAGPDDFLYAPVENARVEVDPATGNYVGTIDGRMTSSCQSLDQVKVIDSGKSIEILPIMKMTEGADCVAGERPFSSRFDLPSAMSVGRHLLHVRSLNGKAVNQMFSVYAPATSGAGH